MSNEIPPDVQESLDHLEALAGALPDESRQAILSAVADCLESLTAQPIAVERRPRSPLRPTVEQIQTVVNRLRDSAQSKPDKKDNEKGKQS